MDSWNLVLLAGYGNLINLNEPERQTTCWMLKSMSKNINLCKVEKSDERRESSTLAL